MLQLFVHMYVGSAMRILSEQLCARKEKSWVLLRVGLISPRFTVTSSTVVRQSRWAITGQGNATSKDTNIIFSAIKAFCECDRRPTAIVNPCFPHPLSTYKELAAIASYYS